MHTMTKRAVARTPALLWDQANIDVVYVLERGVPRYRVEAIKGVPDPFADLISAGVLEVAPGLAADRIDSNDIELSREYTSEQVAMLVSDDKGDH